MKICSSGHDKIYFDSRASFDSAECPMCELIHRHAQSITSLVETYAQQIKSLQRDHDKYLLLLSDYYPEALL